MPSCFKVLPSSQQLAGQAVHSAPAPEAAIYGNLLTREPSGSGIDIYYLYPASIILAS